MWQRCLDNGDIYKLLVFAIFFLLVRAWPNVGVSMAWRCHPMNWQCISRTSIDHTASVLFQFYHVFMYCSTVLPFEVRKDYSGYYCVGCEAYLDDDEMDEGHVCKIHQKECELRSEENYFFRLSKHWDAVRRHVEENPDFILPTSRRSQVLVWLEEDNKRDFSISRASTSWGIPVPGDDSQVCLFCSKLSTGLCIFIIFCPLNIFKIMMFIHDLMVRICSNCFRACRVLKLQVIYVWFDALLGYLSSLLRPDDPATLDTVLQRGWPADVHVIGKDIMRFHALYWPAMLMSAGLPLPKHICTHGFLTKDGLKMGKSLGNVVEPIPLVHDFGADAVRFFFSSCLSFGLDGDFSYETFIKRVNSTLATQKTSKKIKNIQKHPKTSKNILHPTITPHTLFLLHAWYVQCRVRLSAQPSLANVQIVQSGSLANELGNLVHRILTLLRKNLTEPASPLDLVEDKTTFDDHPASCLNSIAHTVHSHIAKMDAQKSSDCKIVNSIIIVLGWLSQGPTCSRESSGSCCHLLWADWYPEGCGDRKEMKKKINWKSVRRSMNGWCQYAISWYFMIQEGWCHHRWCWWHDCKSAISGPGFGVWIMSHLSSLSFFMNIIDLRSEQMPAICRL